LFVRTCVQPRAGHRQGRKWRSRRGPTAPVASRPLPFPGAPAGSASGAGTTCAG